MKSKFAAVLFLSVSLIGSRAAHAEIINFVGQSQSLFYDECFQHLGTPYFTTCAQNFWHARMNWLQGRKTGFAWEAAMWCPQGESTSPQCAEVYANWESCNAAYAIAVDEWLYWSQQ